MVLSVFENYKIAVYQLLGYLLGCRPGHQPSLAKRAQSCLPKPLAKAGRVPRASAGKPLSPFKTDRNTTPELRIRISNSHTFAISPRIFARVLF
jgi:hypothetical protein